jgi:hypothetical protein
MNEGQLRSLLQQADTAASASGRSADALAAMARSTAGSRKRKAQIALASFLMFSLAALALVTVHYTAPTIPPTANHDGVPSPAPTTFERSSRIATAREDAAGTIVVMAQRRKELQDQSEAAELYQRAIKLFPESHWAGIARVELANLPSGVPSERKDFK